MERTPISESSFSAGAHASQNPYAVPPDILADGSRNQIIGGAGETRPWGGLESKGVGTATRKMCAVGSTWGGLQDNGIVHGAGSFFEDFGRSKWFLGAGIPAVEGVPLYIGATASTLLKVAIAVAGVYSLATTYTAGLPQPSAPDVAIVSSIGVGYTGLVNGAISVKIARLRLTTGARSIASTTSVVIVPANQTFRVTFPTAATGQDNWRVFVTQSGFGGVGVHYALAFNGSLDITETSVAAGVVDGVARSLEFEFKDGDLVPETAYIDDYAPPAGTHAIRLDNVMVVLGCYSDSSSSPSSTSTGTCGACSLPNFYESYKPRHLVYFPEQIVDVLSRPTDSYGWIGHKNSISNIQYVGLRDAPAVTVSTPFPDIGIAQPHNWCQVSGLLYMRIAKGGFVRMTSDGALDYNWASPIWKYVKDWDENTVVGSHPDSMSVVISNGTQAYSYSLLSNLWSPTCYFQDAGVSGNIISCTTSRSSSDPAKTELIMSLDDGKAYAWDEGATEMPITSITRWNPSRRPITIFELQASFECDNADNPLIISVHRNLRRVYVRDAQTVSGSDVIESTAATFDTDHTGDMICVFGEDVGGSGIDYLIGRMTYISKREVSLTDPDTGVALLAGASLTNCYALLAHTIIAFPFTQERQQHTPPLLDFLVNECLSHAIGFNLITDAGTGQIFNVQTMGTGQNMPVSLVA